MAMVILIISLLTSLVSLGCWIWTVVRAFQSGKPVLGIVSLCPLVAFIIGWINVKEWNHQLAMTIWSIVFLINLLLRVAAGVLAAGQ